MDAAGNTFRTPKRSGLISSLKRLLKLSKPKGRGPESALSTEVGCDSPEASSRFETVSMASLEASSVGSLSRLSNGEADTSPFHSAKQLAQAPRDRRARNHAQALLLQHSMSGPCGNALNFSPRSVGGGIQPDMMPANRHVKESAAKNPIVRLHDLRGLHPATHSDSRLPVSPIDDKGNNKGSSPFQRNQLPASLTSRPSKLSQESSRPASSASIPAAATVSVDPVPPPPVPTAAIAVRPGNTFCSKCSNSGGSELLAMCPGAPAAMQRKHWCLEDYDVASRIYKGPSSAVYKAVCRHSGLPVALKVYFLARVPANILHMIVREVKFLLQCYSALSPCLDFSPSPYVPTLVTPPPSRSKLTWCIPTL
ncbi:hypothetical protein Agub_g13379 [Astrephomene gubernaculifera]|uniref:Uncharacterized protein n=1 Tax=Astrephomene gubernaculifera TaxID=47775 RepID=A0AAD3E226_9CHLO|nr:hypothetical protein Agub_g13379 [Astrephomene gubernaculifera]